MNQSFPQSQKNQTQTQAPNQHSNVYYPYSPNPQYQPQLNPFYGGAYYAEPYQNQNQNQNQYQKYNLNLNQHQNQNNNQNTPIYGMNQYPHPNPGFLPQKDTPTKSPAHSPISQPQPYNPNIPNQYPLYQFPPQQGQYPFNPSPPSSSVTSSPQKQPKSKEKQAKILFQAWMFLDKDTSGTITLKELYYGLKELSSLNEENDIQSTEKFNEFERRFQEVFQELSKDKRTINFDEFQTAVTKLDLDLETWTTFLANRKSNSQNNNNTTSAPSSTSSTSNQNNPFQQPINPQQNQVCNNNNNTKNGSNKGSQENGPLKTSSEQGNKVDYSWEIDYSELKYEKVLGEGTFGTVYQASWRGSKVAVKELKQLAGGQVALQDFIKELGILSKLRHPNIVLLLGACTKLPHLCMITEFLVNNTLFQLIHQNKSVLTPYWYKKIALETALGMNYLHLSTPKVIHRDLKSLNLLLDHNWTVKVADFGLSRAKADTSVMTNNVGTPLWMAPELIRNENYSEKVDIYSYAIILWEMATNMTPFQGYQPLQVCMAVAIQGYRPHIPPNVRPEFSNLMSKCWDNDPNKRPSFEDIISYWRRINSS